MPDPTAVTYTAAIAFVSLATAKRLVITRYVSPIRNSAFILTTASTVPSETHPGKNDDQRPGQKLNPDHRPPPAAVPALQVDF